MHGKKEEGTLPRIRVAGLLVKEASVLMVGHQKAQQSYWLLPGGGVEYGEALDVALRREMREETDMDVRVGDVAFMVDSIAPDGSRHGVHVGFWVEEVAGTLALGEDDRVVEVKYVGVDELDSLTMHPDIGKELVVGLRKGQGEFWGYLGSRWKADENASH